MKVPISEINDLRDMKKYPSDTQYVLDDSSKQLPIPDFIKENINKDKK